MRVGLLTREWPPDVYGGAGVHVEHLALELRTLVDLEVHCFGDVRPDAIAHPSWDVLVDANSALQVISTDLSMAAALDTVDVLHSHTWYADLAGHLAGLLYDRPHVLTCHSLEPLRPWKAEQLGGGYAVSAWAERTSLEHADAVIAVSEGMRTDIVAAFPHVDPARLHVVHNGVDTDVYRPGMTTDILDRLDVDPDRPSVLFVGRITRQKGVPHLLTAAHLFDPDIQVLLCAGAADTPELGEQVRAEIASLQAERSGVVWVEAMLPRDDVVALLGATTIFVCPSIYEPLGIVNLEAMACGTPVVASAVGGIPEVVADGHTGLLVPYDAARPEAFRAGLAAAVNELVRDPERAAAMGTAGRARAEELFGWRAIAEQTVAVYRSVLR